MYHVPQIYMTTNMNTDNFLRCLHPGAMLRLCATVLTAIVMIAGSLQAQSNVRIIHAVPDAPPIDLYLDDAEAAAVQGLAYSSASGKVALASGTHNIKVAVAGTPKAAAVIDVDTKIGADSSYTVVAVGTIQSLMIQPILLGSRNSAAVEMGKAMVRVVHASPDLGAVDVTITTTGGSGENALLNGLAFKGVTDYIELPAGQITVKARLTTGEGVISGVEAVKSGDVLTIFLMGQNDSGNDLGIYKLDDNNSAIQAPLRRLPIPVAPLAEAEVRVAHLVGDGPPIDIFLDDVTPAAVGALAFRDASSMHLVEPGAHNLKIAAAGAGIGSAIINAAVPVNADTVYTVFAVGSLVPLNVTPIILRRDHGITVPDGKMLVRLLHASIDAGNLDITITDGAGTKKVVSALGLAASTEYMEIAPGTIRVDIGLAGGTPIYSGQGLFVEGDVLTLIPNGRVASNAQFQVNVLFDRDQEEQRPMMMLNPVPTGEGLVRVVHLSPDAPGIDIFVDNVTPPRVADLRFRQASEGTLLSAGLHSIAIGPTGFGIDAALLNSNIEIGDDSAYTFLAVGSVADLSLRPILLARPQGAIPSPGKVLMRMIHASSDAGFLDVTVLPVSGAAVEFNDRAFASETGYVEIPAGAFSVTIRREDGSTLFVGLGSVEPNKLVSLIPSGRIGTEGEFQVNLLIDSDLGEQKPLVALVEVPMTSVDVTTGRAVRLTAYPNPATDRVEINLGDLRERAASVSIHDALGELVGLRETTANGTGVLVIPTEGLASGLYRLVVRSDDGSIVGTTAVTVVR